MTENPPENGQAPEDALRYVWDQIDAILVINLASRSDRWQRFMEKNGSVLPMEKVHRVDAVLGTALPGYGEKPWFTRRTQNRCKVWGGVGGCALSHCKALAEIQSAGWRNALIFEDDIQLASLQQLRVLPKLMQHMRGAYVLYLGYHSVKPYGHCIDRVGDRELWRIEGVLAAHAYLVSAEAASILLKTAPDVSSVWEWVSKYRGMDTYYRDYLSPFLGISVHVIWPVLAEQASLGSDIATGEGGMQSHPTFVSNRPTAYRTLFGVFHILLRPLSLLKTRLNALRTWLRAKKQGLPGYSTPRK